MKAIFFAAILLSSALFATAQTAAPTPQLYSSRTIEDLRAIRQAALASDYAYRQTGYLSNNIGPRLSGSPQAERAVQYVAEEMRKLGLEVRLQKLTVPNWVRGEEKGELIQFPGMAPGTTQKIVLTALGGSIATPPEGMSAEIVVVRNFEELNALGRSKVEGKIVLFNNKFDIEMAASGFGIEAYGQAVRFRGQAAIAAGRLGAVASLVRSVGGSQHRLAHTGAMRYDPNVKPIPAAAGLGQMLRIDLIEGVGGRVVVIEIGPGVEVRCEGRYSTLSQRTDVGSDAPRLRIGDGGARLWTRQSRARHPEVICWGHC